MKNSNLLLFSYFFFQLLAYIQGQLPTELPEADDELSSHVRSYLHKETMKLNEQYDRGLLELYEDLAHDELGISRALTGSYFQNMFKAENYEEAVVYAEHLTSIEPTASNIQNLALTYLKLGELKPARQFAILASYGESTQLHPNLQSFKLLAEILEAYDKPKALARAYLILQYIEKNIIEGNYLYFTYPSTEEDKRPVLKLNSRLQRKLYENMSRVAKRLKYGTAASLYQMLDNANDCAIVSTGMNELLLKFPKTMYTPDSQGDVLELDEQQALFDKFHITRAAFVTGYTEFTRCALHTSQYLEGTLLIEHGLLFIDEYMFKKIGALGLLSIAKSGRGNQYGIDGLKLLKEVLKMAPYNNEVTISLADNLFYFARQDVWFGSLGGLAGNTTEWLVECRDLLIELYQTKPKEAAYLLLKVNILFVNWDERMELLDVVVDNIQEQLDKFHDLDFVNSKKDQQKLANMNLDPVHPLINLELGPDWDETLFELSVAHAWQSWYNTKTKLAMIYQSDSYLTSRGIAPGARHSPSMWRNRLHDEISGTGALTTPKVKVAYMSSDFRKHAMGNLMHRAFQFHDRSRFEVHCYATLVSGDDEVLDAVKEGCEYFLDVTYFTDAQVITQMLQDEIMILVDMNGLTAHARVPIVAARPAPIVVVPGVSYPHTSGHSLDYTNPDAPNYWDYWIGDAIIAPDRDLYSEHMVYMPYTYQLNSQRHMTWPDVLHDRTEENDYPKAKRTYDIGREGAGLPTDAFVFSSVSDVEKLTTTHWKAWMEVLTRVPNSVLWLLAPPPSREGIKDIARQAGVDPDKIHFMPYESNAEKQFSRLRFADALIATWPCGPHTMAGDFLWLGRPVISIALEGFPRLAARVPASLKSALGMQELITSSWEGFTDLAVKLATEPTYYNSIRKKLLARRWTYPAFDTKLWVQHFEVALMGMWQHWLKDGGYQDLAVAPESVTGFHNQIEQDMDFQQLKNDILTHPEVQVLTASDANFKMEVVLDNPRDSTSSSRRNNKRNKAETVKDKTKKQNKANAQKKTSPKVEKKQTTKSSSKKSGKGKKKKSRKKVVNVQSDFL